MQPKTDYSAHEKAYARLLESGHKGWGGSTYQQRMDDWSRLVSEIIGREEFPKPPSNLLELGCGAGDVSLIFASKGYEVSGVEISPTAVKWAKSKFKEAHLSGHFEVGDITRGLAYSDNSFDVIVDGNCLHCIIGEDRSKVWKELRRVLRPRGVLFISTMIGDPKDELGRQGFDPITRIQSSEGRAVRHMPFMKDLIEEINKEGFEVITSKVDQNFWCDHFNGLLRAQ